MSLDLSELRIDRTETGLRIRCRVHPAARRSGVDGCLAGALKVSVAAAPQRGQANRALEALLAERLGLPRQAVAVVAGAAARDKAVTIAGITPDELLRRLAG